MVLKSALENTIDLKWKKKYIKMQAKINKHTELLNFLWRTNTHHIWPHNVTDELQMHKHKETKKEGEGERETGSFYTDRCATLVGPFEKHPFP